MQIWAAPAIAKIPEGGVRGGRAYRELRRLSLFADLGFACLNLDENDVFTFGRPPVSIDILTRVKGLDFDNVFINSSMVKFDGLDVKMIDIRDLKNAKKAAGRAKDIDDLEHL